MVCLIFLYTIMSAYTTGLTELISGYFEKHLFAIPSHLISIISIIVIGLPLYWGVSSIYFLNRLIVVSMAISFFAILFFILPHIEPSHLLETPIRFPTMALPIVFTSFGFLIIIPGLRSYLEDNIAYLKVSIIFGSFIPLLFYLFWVTAVMGIIPWQGSNSLASTLVQAEPVKNITQILVSHTGTTALSYFISLFMLFAILSSFIGTAFGLYHFLVDGLNASQSYKGRFAILVLTLLPPLLMTLTQNKLFIGALGFAGLMSTILFGIYPVALAYSGRYIHKLNTAYRAPANGFLFFIILVFCFSIIVIEFFSLLKIN